MSRKVNSGQCASGSAMQKLNSNSVNGFLMPGNCTIHLGFSVYSTTIDVGFNGYCLMFNTDAYNGSNPSRPYFNVRGYAGAYSGSTFNRVSIVMADALGNGYWFDLGIVGAPGTPPAPTVIELNKPYSLVMKSEIGSSASRWMSVLDGVRYSSYESYTGTTNATPTTGYYTYNNTGKWYNCLGSSSIYGGGDWNRAFPGQYHFFKMWDRALSDAECYTASKVGPNYCDRNGLIKDWRWDGQVKGAIPTTRDLTKPTGNDITYEEFNQVTVQEDAYSFRRRQF